ncbi:MAG TPA: M28 family peptidase [Bacteroidota bacterium]|nr:M28 family peptidase [Bacteroidota bacterium]
MPKYKFQILALFISAVAFSQTSPEIRASDIKLHLKFIASPELEGRASGTEGNRKAAAYIADWMSKDGLEPKGDNGTYFQPFDFVAAVRLGDSNFVQLTGSAFQAGAVPLKVNEDFRPLSLSSNGSVTGPLLFAGYGITAADQNYDDYAGLDARGKVVVVLRYGPEGSDPHSPFAKYTSFRNKARIARDNGAAGIVFINGPRDEQSDDLVKLAFDQSFETSGIPAVSMKREWIEKLLASRGMTLAALQDTMRASKKPLSFPLDGGMLLQTDVIRVKSKTANIIGYLPGNDPALRDQVLILGAHMDHLGYGGRGSGSLAPDTIAIHPGADDNGSGTSGLMEIMQWMGSRKETLKRSVLFIFFSGEELGLLGSAFYVTHPEIPLDRSVAMINMDMVGRLVDKNLTVYGTGTSPTWTPLLDRLDRDSIFALKTVPDGYGPSDQSEFYGKNMPVLFFFTGIHSDYHRPSDTWDKINFEGEEKVVRFVANVAEAVDIMPSAPTFTKVQTSAPTASGDTRSFSVTLGIIPDYSTEASGLRIGGIRPNGPAEKAGLLTGDVIVKMAGKTVLNIYDYMGILGELKAGDQVDVEAVRNGQHMTVHATMQKRQ